MLGGNLQVIMSKRAKPVKVLMFPPPSGSAVWRMTDPSKYLNRCGMDVQIATEGITKEAVEWADIYVLSSCIDKNGIALMYEYQQEHGKKIIVDADDLPHLNEDNPFKMDHDRTNASAIIEKTFEIADLITTTNDYLAGKLEEFNENVVVLPNYMDLERWQRPKLKNTSDTIRIGWTGSITHYNDLLLLQKPFLKLANEYPKIRYIFMGDMRVKDMFKGLPVEAMLGVPFEWYPDRLHSLRLDIAVAPLRDTRFNNSKSNIKWQEYALACYPGVYSPTVYQTHGFDGRFGMIAYNDEAWYRIIKNMIEHEVIREDITSQAYARLLERFDLKRNIHKWVTAYESI